ncbi:hypothetical protein KDA_48510 [Dictyobacter alpinus]|uniref:Uncharacterized protein n=1 Tax=Dictyobacter alpinus TaxID=2014873 RepID=A0A402BDM5_9CHLR|nr:hypothetical protein KDA_48510 [Dictyobacter alpinus]
MIEPNGIDHIIILPSAGRLSLITAFREIEYGKIYQDGILFGLRQLLLVCCNVLSQILLNRREGFIEWKRT